LKDSRIKIYINEKNIGDYPNRNKAAFYATGDYLIYVDSDDRIEKEGIEICVNIMNTFPLAGFGMYYPYPSKPFQLTTRDAVRNHLMIKPFLGMGPGGTILRTKFFIEVMGGYPIKYGPANDMYFNIAACCKSPIVMIPYRFMFYREHNDQESKNKFAYLYHRYNYLADLLKDLELPLTKKEKAWVLKKNKRRFSINLLKYYFATFSFKDILFLCGKANFTKKDFFEGLFLAND
jgi:glycosyltransferase involved in cell wall biosynthesis